MLDLLLGTQGWRRFAEQDPNLFRNRFHKEAERHRRRPDRQRHEEEGERLLVMIGQSKPREIDLDKVKMDQVVTDFQTKADRLKANHDEAVATLERAGGDPDYTAAFASLGQLQRMLLDGPRLGGADADRARGGTIAAGIDAHPS